MKNALQKLPYSSSDAAAVKTPVKTSQRAKQNVTKKFLSSNSNFVCFRILVEIISSYSSNKTNALYVLKCSTPSL